MSGIDTNISVTSDNKVIVLDNQEKRESPFLDNIAADLKKNDPQMLRDIGITVCEDYKNDVQSRSKWDVRAKDWNKLYHGLKEVKNSPWPNASNVKIPILATASLQFHARAYDQILPSTEIAKCWSTDGKSVNQAERCEKYLNWQLTEDMDEWVEEQDLLLLILPIYGSCVKKTFYDPNMRRPVSMVLRYNEFVAPYGVNRLEYAPRKTHVYPMTLNDIKVKGATGIWINLDGVEDNIPGDHQDMLAEGAKEVGDEATGTEQSTDHKDNRRQILEQHRTWDINGDGIEEWYAITVDKDTNQVLRIESLEYNDPMTGEPKVYDAFTPYSLIPNIDSWMGLGFGHLLEHLNEAANTLLNQLVDAGRLANIVSGFFNMRSGISDGDLEIVMGKFKGVEMSVEDINKSIYQFKFNPPSQVLYALLEKIHSYAQQLSSVSDTMLGQLPPSDTTATTMLTVMEQGLKLFSTIAKRLFRSEKKEFRKIMLLNALFIDKEKYVVVQDSKNTNMSDFTLEANDFKNYIDVIPVADPNITSRAEKLIKAKEAYQLVMGDKEMAEDPQARYEVRRRYFEALEIKNIEQILKKPEETVPPDLTPIEEEAQLIKEVYVAPLEHQDHNAHIESHKTFEASDIAAQQLTPQGKKLLTGHLRETWSMFYLQLKQSEEEAKNAEINAGAEGAVPGLAQPPVLGPNVPGA